MNTIDLIAAIAMAALIFFTVGGMYASACRTVFIDRNSETSKLILGKFGSTDDLHRFDAEFETMVAAEADGTLHHFSAAFMEETAQTRKGLDYPTPKARFSNFL